MITQEKMPTFVDVDWLATIAYRWKVFLGRVSGKITSSLPDDALSQYFGVKNGGDNRDVRARLLLSNFLQISTQMKIGSMLPIMHFVYRSNEPRYSIRGLIKDYPYSVLVFVGIYPDHDDAFQSDFVRFKKHIPPAFNKFLITNQYDISAYDSDDDVLGDYDAAVHHQLPIPISMLFVVDSAGTIVWKSMWKERDESIGFLQSLEVSGE